MFKLIYLYLTLTLIPIFNAGMDNEIVNILLILGLGGMVYYNFKCKENIYIEKNSPLYFYLIFIIYAGLSFFWSIYKLRTMIEFLQLLLYGLVLFLTINLSKEEKMKTIKIVTLFGFLIALLGILEYVFIKPQRIVSTFFNPNPFGTYLVMLFLFSLGFYLKNEKRKFAFSSVVFFIALLLSGSRGALIALVVSLPFIFLDSKGSAKRDILRTLFIVIAGFILTRGLVYITPIVQNNLNINIDFLSNLIRKDSLTGTSFTGRIEFWKAGLRAFIEKPRTGFGLGTFFSAYFLGYGKNQWYSRFAHNHYIQTLTELGIIGFILFLIFVGSVIFTFFKIYKKEHDVCYVGSFAAIIAFFAHIFIEFSWNFPAVTMTAFWIIGLNLSSDKSKYILNIKPLFSRIISIGLLLLVILHTVSTNVYKIGFKFEDNGDDLKALKAYHTINTIYPINPNGMLFESNIYVKDYNESLDLDKLDKGIEYAEKAVDLAPFEGKLHTHLAQLYYSKGDYENAKKEYELGKKYAAYVVSRHFELARFYLSQGDTESAIKTLIEAAKLEKYQIMALPESDKHIGVEDAVNIHILLYNTYLNIGREDLAKKEAEIIIDYYNEYEFLNDYINIEAFK